MSMRYKGGVVSATPPTVTTTSAPGLWTLEQQMQYQAAGVWPPSVLPDPYFEYVTMLLHGDGTNGAQNNTFLDSSTNNFTITRNGDATQGSFSPFSRADGYWSNYFDGSGDFLNTNSLTLSGDFTVEAWVYMPSTSTAYCVIGVGDDFSGGFIFHTTNTGALRVFGNNAQVIVGSGTVTTNTWNHVAFVRSGSTNTLYLNGVSQGTATNSTSWSGTVRVGREIYAGNLGIEYLGYISNVRVVNGTAVYTGAFTPPTSPLTAIANTALLTCQSNRFKDNSTNAYTITPNGNVAVQVFNPFNPTTAYDTATNGGSGYFDGSGDSLSIANNAAFNLDFGDATIEAWVYYTSQPGSTGQSIFDCMIDNVSGYNFYSYPYGAGGIAIAMQSFNGGYQQIYVTNNYIPVGVWAHVAFTRASGTNRFFVNGVQCTTNTGTFTSSLASGGNTIYVGARSSGNPFYGYISNLRVLKGTALYTANFTPPTAPLTNITNTSLLLNFTNGGIFDNAAMSDSQTVGNFQISTSVFKYGTGSLAFDGNGDYLFVPPNRADISNFDTGNFTIEFWWYPTTLATTQPLIYRTDNAAVPFAYDYVITYNTSLGLRFYTNLGGSGTVSQGATTGWSTNTWYHVAVVRSGTTLTIYRNGTSIASGTNSNNLTNTSGTPMYIGGEPLDPLYSTGYIDDLRITKGYARYTANFTPPTAAFPNL
jgi:hypothetical protein